MDQHTALLQDLLVKINAEYSFMLGTVINSDEKAYDIIRNSKGRVVAMIEEAIDNIE